MSIHDHEFSGLNWVKGEIEESLNQTRLALEGYVEDQNDVTQLRFCITYLHQIRGTLQMLELYGAELLAEEMEYVAQALLEDSVARREDALEVLMRAILQMPNYLERLQAGHTDIPLILLPLLNDLRASRGKNLLSENVLFSPDLSVETPPQEQTAPEEGDQTPPSLRKLRQIFQTSLVAWFRDADNHKALQHMISVVNQIASQLPKEHSQMWWVAKGLLSTIAENTLEMSISVKTLLGQIDREIKQLIDTGEQAYSSKSARELVKNMLFYIAHSHSNNPLVSTLKEAFQLDQLLPNEDEIDQARGTLSGPDKSLLQSVSTALQEELLNIKEALDLYVRNPASTDFDLASMAQNLRQVGDTLGMLGQGVLRSSVLEQTAFIQRLASGEETLDDASLMKVASALLAVESSLANLVSAQALAEGEQTQPDAFAEDGEYQQLMQDVIKEALVDIGQIKNAVITFASQPDNFELLHDTPRLLSQVKGGLLILGIQQPIELLQNAGTFIQQTLLEQHTRLDPQHTDRLADTITSIEYYLEALAERRADRPEILAFGHHSLEALKRQQQAAAPLQEPAQPAAATTVTEEALDDDLREVFVEEAQEEIENTRQQLDRWQQSPDNQDALAILRRAFHTLKGSGRLVGASDIGEFAWAIESMLNRVIDNTIDPSPAMFSLLNQVLEALPPLVAAFQARQSHDLDLGPMVQQAQALTETATIEAPPAPAAPEPASVQPAAGSEQEQAGQSPTEIITEVEQPAQPVTLSVEALTPSEETEQHDEVLEIFLEEAEELLQHIDATLHKNLAQPTHGEWLDALHRDLHTLKGSARMANVGPIGDFSHHLESLLAAMTEQQLPVNQTLLNFLQQAHDQLLNMTEQVQQGQDARLPENAIAQIEEWLAAPELTEQRQSAPTAAAEAPPPGPRQIEVNLQATATGQPILPPVSPAVTSETLRVRAEALDAMVSDSAELGIYKSRISQQLSLSRYNLAELHQTVNRIHQQMRTLEIETEAQMQYRSAHYQLDHNQDFDTLELDRFTQIHQLSRSLMEGVNDLENIYKLLQNHARDTEVLVDQQHRKQGELHNLLMQTRLVPFASVTPRLRRIVRQTADTLEKQVELHFANENLELDRSVLNHVMPALEHLLRNAIDHGIEPPAARRQQGKQQTGNITVKLTQQANQITVDVRDDGRGLDVRRIKERAIELGLISDTANLTNTDIAQYILESGLSTAAQLTQISGRGVGLDVVNNEVKRVGGSLYIDSSPQQGTCFSIKLPLTLATQHVLMAKVEQSTYALPLTGFLGMARMTREEYEQQLRQEKPTLTYQDQSYQLLALDNMLGHNSCKILNKKYIHLLLYRLNDHNVALHTDTLNGHHEIVMKPLGPQASALQSLAGGTILGDGRVVLILDLATLVRSNLAHQGHMPVLETVPEQTPGQPRKCSALVVDDSLTVRKVTSRFLQRHDMEASAARDGFDALEQLQTLQPDIILLDVEMPRMDGFEFAAMVRNDPRLKHIPIIMITSRTGDKHRQRALEIGVDLYLGKPYNETELLDSIHALTQRH